MTADRDALPDSSVVDSEEHASSVAASVPPSAYPMKQALLDMLFVGVCQQVPSYLFLALLLVTGSPHRYVEIAFIAYWLGIVITLLRRWGRLLPSDGTFIRASFFPMIFATMVLSPIVFAVIELIDRFKAAAPES